MNDAFTTLCTKLFLPLVKFFLRRGLKVQEFSEALKHALVIAAREEFEREGVAYHMSNIAAATGIHRRDVARLLNEPTPKTGSINLLAKVLGQWENDKRFSKNGNPLTLSLGDKKNSFYDLVYSVSQDLNPTTVLTELVRVNFVNLKDDDVVPSAGGFFQIQPSLEEAARMLSYNVKGLCEAVESNISSTQATPHLHIATTYDNISQEKLPEVRKWILHEGSSFHRKVRDYLSKFDKDINPELSSHTGGGKVIVGSFSFDEASKISSASKALFSKKKRGVK